ncbi:RsmD family RNA methyltransferase, partial [Pseudomonas aeruginosa]
MKKPNHSGSGQIRIIGGQWRGRKLPVPDSPGLRPTTSYEAPMVNARKLP